MFDVIRMEAISEELSNYLLESTEIDGIIGELRHVLKGFFTTLEL